MGKKKTRGEGSGLGRALIKERLNAGRGYRRNDTWVRNYESNPKVFYFFFHVYQNIAELIWRIYEIRSENTP